MQSSISKITVFIALFLSVFLTPVDAFTADTVIQTDRILMNRPDSNNKDIVFSTNNGATFPVLRATGSGTGFQFSNDGVNFSSLGTGGSGGGSAGIAVNVVNGNFEQGSANGWTPDVSGDFSVSNSSPLDGSYSAIFTPASSSEKVCSTLATVQPALQGQSCQASTIYNTAEATYNYVYSVKDGNGNVLASEALSPTLSGSASSFAPTLSYPCPSTSPYEVQQCVAAPSSGVPTNSIKLDDFTAGQAAITLNGPTVSPAQSYSSSVGGVGSGSGSVTAAYSRMGQYAVIDGLVTVTSATGSSAVTFSLPSGLTIDTTQPNGGVIGSCSSNTTGTAVSADSSDIYCQIYTGAVSAVTCASGCAIAFHTLVAITQWESQPSSFSVPAMLQDWVIRDTIANGSNDQNLGTSSVGSISSVNDSGFTLADASYGTQASWITCSGASSTGTTCASGTPQIGIQPYFPTTGLVKACAEISAGSSFSGSYGTLNQIFYVSETADGSDTAISSTSGVQTGLNDGSGPLGTYSSVTTCGVFPVNTVGRSVDFKVQYTTGLGGGSGYTLGNNFAGPVNWTITPITQNVSVPVPVGTVVSSNQSGVIRVDSTIISSSGTILSNYGNFVSSVTAGGAGIFTVNFSVPFSNIPVCVLSPAQATNAACSITNFSTGYITYACTNLSNTAAASEVSIMCQGPK